MTVIEKKSEILIVEDDVLIASDLESQLTGLGYAVYGKATSTDKALKLIEKRQPDLVMLDIVLKGDMDGIEAAEIMRDKWGLPVVFLTAETNLERLECAKPTNFFGYVLKPIQEKLLKMTLQVAFHMVEMDGRLRQAEKELKESDRRLQLLIENMADMVSRHLADSTITYVSPSCENLLGYKPEELLNMRSAEFLHPEDVEMTIAVINGAVSQQDGNYRLVHRLRRHDGKYIWVETVGRLIYGADGDLAELECCVRDITEQKLSEAVLKESEENHKTMIANISDVIAIMDSNGIIRYKSPNIEQWFGWRPEDLIGGNGWATVHPEDLERIQHEFLALIDKDETTQTVEYRYKCKDGSYKWIELTAVNLENDLVIGGVLMNYHDITQRKQAETALRESENHFRTLVENIPQKVFLKDANAVYVTCNPSFARDLGIKPEDIKGRTDYDFFSVSMADKYRGDDQRIMESGRLEHLTEIYEKNGKKYWVSTVKSPIKDKSDRINGILGIFWDITENKLAEEAIRESEARFKQLFDNMADGVAIYKAVDDGRDFVFMDINRKGQELSRISREEVVGVRVTKAFPTVKQMGLLDVFQRVYQIGEAETHPLTLYKDGRLEQWVENYVSKLPSGYIVAIYSDNTEKRRVEEEKNQLQTQLQQSQKMEAIGTLAGGIAHDFNNILQGISGLTQLILLDMDEDSPHFDNLNSILSTSYRAKDLIHQLLLFSRKLDSVKEMVSLNQMLEQSKALLERTIPKMIDIQLQLGRLSRPINVDPVQIEQIILNLGANAADAMPDGGKLTFGTAEVTLDEDFSKTHLETEPGKYILLTVADTGHGMDRETAAHIFEPFYTTKDIGKGTGLGLASVYGIVKSHGGFIKCNSEVGQGTTFKIYLPSIEQAEMRREVELEGQPPQGGTETILIVDDEKSIRDFSSQLLIKFGYIVLLASSGEEALEVYDSKSNEIDLVILDIGMPGMGGRQCLLEILKIAPSAKVVIASGYAKNGQLKETVEAGAVGYIAKPFNVEDMLEKVRAVLDEKDM